MKTPESILSVKGLDYCSFADVSVSEINGGKDELATIAHYETSQNPDEIHNDLLFDDCEEGKLISKALSFIKYKLTWTIS